MGQKWSKLGWEASFGIYGAGGDQIYGKNKSFWGLSGLAGWVEPGLSSSGQKGAKNTLFLDGFVYI